MRIRSWSYARISLLLAATAITPVLVASGVRAAGQPQPLAHVAYILRGLAVQPAHRAAQTASVGTPVFPQDGADTQAGQRASFRFRDGTALHLNQETSVIFRSPSETELARGEIAQYLTPGSTHRIVTASAIASAIGTEIDVYLHGNDSIFVVLEGALQVSNAHGSVVVKNNQETTVAPGAAPTPPSPVDAQAVFAWNASIPTPDLGKDIALDSNGGVIVGSSSEAASAAGTWDVQRVNDGVLSEGWASADGQTQAQFVKIGFHGFIGHTSFRVSGVVIDPAATSGDSASEDLRDFEIRVSTTGTDDASFATVFIGTCRQEAVLQRFPFPAAVVAKYVELVALDNYGSTERVAVAELEVVATTTAFNYPTGLALDRRGNLYVADTANNRIQEISPRGTVLHLWGSKGNGDGQFLNPMGVGVGRNGQIVVADTFNHRVQFFSSPGHFLRTFRDASQLTTPTTVALDTQDTAYVGDSSGRRILKLSSTGRLLASWALSRSAPFPCTSPGALAVDPAGAVWDAYYASATNGHYRIRVEKRAPNGRVLVSWSLPGVVSTCDNAGMAVDAAENVWLTLTAVHEVEELTPAGRKIARWGGLGLGVGRFIQPIGIAVGSQGAVWVADSGNDRVQKLTPRGKSVAQFGSYGTIPQTLGECPGVAVDAHGYAYITDFSNDRIQVRAPDGSVAAILGHRGLPVIGRGPPTVPLGQFDRPWGIAVGQDGAIYVADQIGDRIQKLAPRGPIAAFGAVPVGAFGGSGQGPGFNRPDGVAVARSGDLYVADTGNNRIVKLAPDGSVVASWGSRGSGPDQFNGPAGVAVDQDGNVFVADAANNRIQEFTPSGQFLAMWGTLGSGPGQFRLPAAIAVDAAGNLYVADALNGRVQKLSHDGHPLAQWSGGSGSSQLAVPTGVAVDAQGNVYVADLGAFQVVKLSPDGAVLAIWS